MHEGPQFISEDTLPREVRKIDAFPAALRELFFVTHPEKSKMDSAVESEVAAFISGSKIEPLWVYYDWLSAAVRIPTEDVYFQLRTARNRNLITEEEQKKYRAATVAIAGLSVGSTALSTLVATGGPKNIRIADPDTIEITNLNRINASLLHVTMNKAEVAARKAWELDPFLAVRIEGALSKDNIDEFVRGTAVFIDEMDDIRMKVESRNTCRALGIPVIMATDNADGTILDVERFDKEPGREIFHGRITLPTEELTNIDREKFVRLANMIIDESLFSERQRTSVHLVGTSLAGVPQIATAAALSGVAVAYATRKIILGEPLPSGRYVIDVQRAFSA